jgi:hypothetical protein
VQARRAMDAAYEAELVMALAAVRPDSDDPHQATGGRGGEARGRRCPARVSSCRMSWRWC